MARSATRSTFTFPKQDAMRSGRVVAATAARSIALLARSGRAKLALRELASLALGQGPVSRTRCSVLHAVPQSRDPFCGLGPGSAAHHAARAARCAASGARQSLT